MFCPQRPYIPLGTLRAAAAYPQPPATIDPEAINRAFARAGLKYLVSRLDDKDISWDKMLSGGEQQRLAFVRILLHKPDVLIMDESTSALDEASQESLMNLFKEELAHMTVITVGHRPSLADYHEKRLVLVKQEQKGARLQHHTPAQTQKESPRIKTRQVVAGVIRRVFRRRRN
jgi:putative ATP-binding cassette transporter